MSVWLIRVAVADPAMPSRGNGPNPVISRGFRITSIPTAATENQNGVLESPAPRWAIITNEKKYMNGIAAKITRR